ncbi:MAG: alanine racemase [Bacteroidales bacterium]|nr:alanine racemase [Bacteroidales bacterium]
MDNTSYIEISKKAYKSNIRFLKKVVGDNVKISSVVKGNAYGHGCEQMIPLAEQNGINHFSVFSAYEAKQIANYISDTSDIMILGFITAEQLEWVIENDIEFYVSNVDGLENAGRIARLFNKKAKIHLELETGFKRTGIEPEEFDRIILYLHENVDNFEVKGICTHFAGAESIANYVRVKNQLIQFKKHNKYFIKNNINAEYLHASSSSAALIYPETRFNMVRIGIAQYGFWPTLEVLMTRNNKYGDRDASLKRVISWKSEIMAIKKVKKSEFVGYGNSFQAAKDMTVAVVPVGYNNGYSRSLSNRGHVLVHGKRAEVVGVVTMNTITVNITDVKNAQLGDEVILIGSHNKNKISVASFSEMSNYLNYQILARLPMNIPRFVVE